MNQEFNVRRVRVSLYREGRRRGINQALLADIQHKTMSLVGMSGIFSQNRKMASRIGRAVMNESTTILCPICLDYGNLGNYKESIQQCIRSQTSFLKRVCKIIPGLIPTFLLPNQEVVHDWLWRFSGRSNQEILDILDDVGSLVFNHIKPLGWECDSVLSMFPDITKAEQEIYESLKGDQRYRQKLEAHAYECRDMLRIRARSLTFEDMILKTAQMAAQYIALGRLAAERNMLICNYTTKSLRWYMETPVAVLHNPISLG